MPGQQQPIATTPPVTDDDHRVIQFRPRTLPKSPTEAVAVPGRDRGPAERGPTVRLFRPKPFQSKPPPLSQFETASAGGEDSNYDRRMLSNVAALVFILLLTGVAVWLATTLNDMRRTQDCIMVGRRDCAKLPIPTILPPHDAENI